MKVRGYITHKAAEKFSDCADYFGICPRTKRVAVSDGVSQSTMPLEWARILVNAYVKEEWEPKGDLSLLKETWRKEAESFLASQKRKGIYNWMLENNLSENYGAGATFCGLAFSDGNSWTASILGDTCLVIIKDKHIVGIYASKEGDFGNRPDYFDSINEKYGEVKTKNGILKEGDIMLIVSDPFSELLFKIQHSENESIIIDKILALKSFDEFSTLIDELREKFGMHNDDSTLVIVEYDGAEDLKVTEERSLDSLIKKEKEQEEEEQIKRKNQIANDDKLWEKAKVGDTIVDYENYLQESTIKCHSLEARSRIRLLKQDEEDWKTAVKNDTEKGYKDYLESHPQGKNIQNANNKLIGIKTIPINSKDTDVNGEEKGEPTSEDPVSSNTGEKKETTNIEVSDEQTSGHMAPDFTSETQSGEFSETKNAEYFQETTANPPKKSETRKHSRALHSGKGYEVEKYKHKDEMEAEVEVEVEEPNYRVKTPINVDSSDSINIEEFRNLLETAESLFNNHLPSFVKAFNIPKWRTERNDNISRFFRQFWLELGEVIYKKNNG